MFDPKIVLEVGTTERYGNAVLNPDGSLIGGGAAGTTMYTALYDYDINNNPIYIGEAPAGSYNKKASGIWRIKKLIYDGNNNCIAVIWAGGDTKFDNIWDNRAVLIYS